ncbi:MAG: S9 family peptidase [Terracidiphilus sp.]|nr:S9 family peptidase [Terracidiphilus sp.]MDR3798089.1 S9 family peptidase [Terracidiphilus sp.]
MRLSSALLVFAAVFAVPSFSSGQNTTPVGESSPAGSQTASAERATSLATKRPMTFEDMMQMKRLGDTAVSPDGKWLAYAVTTVDLAQNTKTMELWLQAIAGAPSAGPTDQSSAPFKLGVAQPGDSGVQFAPDGKRILFISGRTGANQIWLADFDSATGATTHLHKLTNLDLGVDNAKWSPDSKSIVFTAAVYPDCPAIVPDDNGAGAECNYDRDAKAADSKVKAQIFTQLLYRHWNHYTGEKRSHLFLIAVDGSGMRDLNAGDVHDVPTDFPTDPIGCGCDISPDGKELAFTENVDAVPAVSTNSDIFTLDLTDPHAKPVKVSTSLGGDLEPAYSPDGKWLAWRSQARAGYESDKFRLIVYDRAAKTIKDLLPKFDNWVDEFAWSLKSPFIYFISGNRGENSIYDVSIDSGECEILDIESELQLPVNEERLTGEFAELKIVPLAKRQNSVQGGEVIVATKMSVDRPSEVVIVHENDVAGALKSHPEVKEGVDSTIEQLTHLNDTLLAQFDLPKMESFWFTAQDKTKLEGFLIRPPGFDAAKKYPVKFLIHGGPQGNWGDDWSYRWNAELFAANGYVVIMINMRGSTGYGQAIVDGVNGDWGGKPFTDLMEGLDYAEQHYPFIDKDRECALGASYGGYMADWVLGHTNRFKCIVSHDGMFDAESAFGTTEEDWFNIWEFKFPNTQGGHPWDYYGKPDAENPYRKWSPSLYAKNFKTPTLVVHGQLDYRLDVSEGFQLFDTLQMLGVPSKMLYFPDEGHWVLKPQNSQLWWKTVNDWVDQWTKGRD